MRIARGVPTMHDGQLLTLEYESRILADNPLGDPHVRRFPVWVPSSRAGRRARLPVLFCLAPYTGSGWSVVAWQAFRESMSDRLARLVAEDRMGPVIVVFPDCFTCLGGNQYVNSSAVGRYADYVALELVPLLERELPCLPERRGIAGKSSGGFGALHLALSHPGLFRAVGSISGDCGFDFLFPGEFLACLRGLVAYEGDPARFLAAFRASPDFAGDAHAILNTLAMAACYSPNLEAPLGFDLPFDLETGELLPEVWARWLAFDPLVAAESRADALRDLALLHLECGLRDEFHLQWSLRRLSRRLSELGVRHDHEEHSGGHRGLAERFPPLFSKMARALT